MLLRITVQHSIRQQTQMKNKKAVARHSRVRLDSLNTPQLKTAYFSKNINNQYGCILYF